MHVDGGHISKIVKLITCEVVAAVCCPIELDILVLIQPTNIFRHRSDHVSYPRDLVSSSGTNKDAYLKVSICAWHLIVKTRQKSR